MTQPEGGGRVMTPTVGRIRWMVQKYRHLVDSFVLRRAPEFVWARAPSNTAADVPVFTFHAVLPEFFEEQCEHLVRNGYRTLSANEFLERLNGGGDSDPAVVLTFDDGLKQVWTVAHPILEKYGLQATCFLIPGLIPEDGNPARPTMADVWAGKVPQAVVEGFDVDEPRLATWPEIREMHERGTFSFHSHTMHHALVPVSDQVFDFVNPTYNPHFFGNIHVPLYQLDGEDVVSRDPIPGLPIFKAEPRMYARRRFIPDERLVRACIDRVSRAGGEDFFLSPSWRRVLNEIVTQFHAKEGALGRFEEPQEREHAIRAELAESQRAIEERLPSGVVTHLAFPWFSAHESAVRASKALGFEVNYFGLSNGAGHPASGGPHRISRLDEFYLKRLPGAGRATLLDLAARMKEIRKMPGRLFARTSTDAPDS